MTIIEIKNSAASETNRRMKVRFLNRKGCFRWSITGVVLVFLGVTILVTDPVTIIMNKALTVSDGSFMGNILEKPPIEILIKVYIFNITNGDRFLSGNDTKLKLEEVGPYIFKESRENQNMTYNENKTLTFSSKTFLEYVPELSVGNMKTDRVMTPNLAMLALATLSSNSFLLSLSLNTLIKTWKQNVIHSLTVEELLMGYDDQFVVLANSLMPHWISFSKFGIIDRLYDLGENIITMNVNETSEDLYKIVRWNGSPGLSKWNYKDDNSSLLCNTIEGTYEGVIFPRHMDKIKSFNFYKKSFCRHLPLDYAGTIMLPSGLKGIKYDFPYRAMSCNETDNYCFCNKERPQYPYGFIDVSPCYYDLPLALSLPHFDTAEPHVSEKFEGLKPDPKKHSNVFIVQPDVGMPIKFHSRMQVNLMVNSLRYNTVGKPFRNMYLPILWIDAGMDELPKHLMNLIIIGTRFAPVAQSVIGWVSIAAGFISLIFAAIVFLKLRAAENIIKNEKPIRIIPLLTKKKTSN